MCTHLLKVNSSDNSVLSFISISWVCGDVFVDVVEVCEGVCGSVWWYVRKYVWMRVEMFGFVGVCGGVQSWKDSLTRIERKFDSVPRGYQLMDTMWNVG